MRLDRAAVQTAVEEMEGDHDFETVIREDYRGKGEEQEGFGLTFPSSNEIQEFLPPACFVRLDYRYATGPRRQARSDGQRFYYLLSWLGVDGLMTRKGKNGETDA